MFSKALFINENYIDSYKWNPDYYSNEYIELEKKTKKLSPLGLVIDQVTNGPHGGVNYVDKLDKGAIPYLRAQNLEDGIVNTKNLVYISQKDHESHDRAEVVPGDIVLTITGVRVGEAAIIPNTFKKANIIQSLAKLKINKDLINEYYLLAFLNSDSGRKLSYRQTSTTAQAGLNFDAIKNIQIYLPSKKIQNYIGDKIRKAEQLREETTVLEKEINGILKEGLEIETFGISEKGKKYAWIDSNIIDERIDAGYFSNKYLLLDELEKNIKFIPLSELILDIKTGKTPSNEADDENGTVLIAVNNVIPNNLEIDKNIRRVKISDNLLLTHENDLLITRVGTVGVCGVVESYQEGLALSDNVIAVKLKKSEIPIRYIATYLNSPSGRLQIERIVKGAVQSVINYPSIKALKIPILDIEHMNQIDILIRNWKENLFEASKLIQEANQDVESLLEGTFEEFKINNNKE